MAKYKITWASGQEEEAFHEGDKDSLIAEKWGSTPVPEGCTIEEVEWSPPSAAPADPAPFTFPPATEGDISDVIVPVPAEEELPAEGDAVSDGNQQGEQHE